MLLMPTLPAAALSFVPLCRYAAMLRYATAALLRRCFYASAFFDTLRLYIRRAATLISGYQRYAYIQLCCGAICRAVTPRYKDMAARHVDIAAIYAPSRDYY